MQYPEKGFLRIKSVRIILNASFYTVQIPTRIPEKIVVALFSGILVNSGILVVAGIVLSK